jgi:hypothetical protein
VTDRGSTRAFVGWRAAPGSSGGSSYELSYRISSLTNGTTALLLALTKDHLDSVHALRGAGADDGARADKEMVANEAEDPKSHAEAST